MGGIGPLGINNVPISGVKVENCGENELKNGGKVKFIIELKCYQWNLNDGHELRHLQPKNGLFDPNKHLYLNRQIMKLLFRKKYFTLCGKYSYDT